MPKKLDPRVARHLHRDTDVTPQRVRAFGAEKYATRLRVLAELRWQANDDSSSAGLSLAALVLSTLAFLIAPRVVPIADMSFVTSTIVLLVVGVIALAVLLPLIIPGALSMGRRDRARVWLGAYSDEVERRRSSKANKNMA